MYFCLNFEPIHCSMSSSNYCFLTCLQVSQEEDQLVWYSHLFKNFPQFVVIHIVKGFSIVNEAEIDVFSGIPLLFLRSNGCWIWSLVPLPFLNPACTSGSSRFTYCWSLAWRILSITLLACKMSTIGRNHLDSVYLSEARKINEILGMKFRNLCNIKPQKEVWENTDSIGNIFWVNSLYNYITF